MSSAAHTRTPPLHTGTPTASGTRPLTQQLTDLARIWSRSQYELVVLAAQFADSHEWIAAGSPTAAHWLAHALDVEPCTGREWIRIGKKLRTLTAIADAFANGHISYSKVRTLTRIATPENQRELLAIAVDVPAAELGRSLALWLKANTTDEELEQHHQQQRSVRWKTEADGMVLFTMRLPPLLAGILIALLTSIVMRTKPKPRTSERWPTASQQHADAFQELLTNGVGSVETEVVLHVRGDGCTTDDGTPIADTVMERIAPKAFIRALIHDAETNPADASNRRRHPTTKQKRIVKERDKTCVDCGRAELLHYDHQPPYDQTGHTITTELQLRCAPCHHRKHRRDGCGHRSLGGPLDRAQESF